MALPAGPVRARCMRGGGATCCCCRSGSSRWPFAGLWPSARFISLSLARPLVSMERQLDWLFCCLGIGFQLGRATLATKTHTLMKRSTLAVNQTSRPPERRWPQVRNGSEECAASRACPVGTLSCQCTTVSFIRVLAWAPIAQLGSGRDLGRGSVAAEVEFSPSAETITGNSP